MYTLNQALELKGNLTFLVVLSVLNFSALMKMSTIYY